MRQLARLQHDIQTGKIQLQTPSYVYVVEEITRQLIALRDATGTDILYSFKACPLGEVIMRIPIDAMAGIEVASLGELSRVASRRSGIRQINTVMLTKTLARAGLGCDATFVLDAPQQLDTILAVTAQRNLQPVLLRVNPQAVCEQLATSMPRSHFGMDLSTLLDTADALRAAGAVRVGGLHLYAGKGQFASAALKVADGLSALANLIEARLGYPLTILNLGGGFTKDWDSIGFNFRAYRERLEPLKRRYRLLHEAGSGVVGTSGLFFTRVIGTKSLGKTYYAICDGGLPQNFLLARTESIIRKHQTPFLINRAGVDTTDVECILVGPTCNVDDVLATTSTSLRCGDIVVFTECGAYNRTYTVNRFLDFEEPKVYVV